MSRFDNNPPKKIEDGTIVPKKSILTPEQIAANRDMKTAFGTPEESAIATREANEASKQQLSDFRNKINTGSRGGYQMNDSSFDNWQLYQQKKYGNNWMSKTTDDDLLRKSRDMDRTRRQGEIEREFINIQRQNQGGEKGEFNGYSHSKAREYARNYMNQQYPRTGDVNSYDYSTPMDLKSAYTASGSDPAMLSRYQNYYRKPRLKKGGILYKKRR